MKEDSAYATRRLAVEASIRAAAALSVYGGRVSIQEVAPYFINNSTGALLLIHPTLGTLVYKDFSHVNVDGGVRLEQLFRKVIFNETICK